ncbi:MAG: PPC domain-containing protein [Nitrospinae bacterium]|nr:PPC domain-containing protein [Nitrospinota bacterium]
MSRKYEVRSMKKKNIYFLFLTSYFLLFLASCGGGSSDGTSPSGSSASTGSGGSSSPDEIIRGSGSVKISGTVQYEDRTFDRTGFTGAEYKAVRFADIEIVNASNSSVIASTATDGSGNYSISLSPISEGVYVRCLTSTSIRFKNSLKSYNIEVVNGNSSVYSIVSDAFSISSSGAYSKNLTASVSSGAGGPFNILDILIDGAEFVVSKNGGFTSGKVKAFWYDGSTDGTYYNSATNTLHFLGKATDSDSYDDMVILHEFGHWIANNFSKDNSPGGDHTVTGHYDIRLAWSEGWATFFACSVRSYAGYSNPQYYVDTTGESGNGNLLFSYEIETPSYSSYAKGSDNELAVASVLWDIFDDANDDNLSMGFSGIWDVAKNYLPSAAEVSLEDFWDGWFYRGYGSPGNPISIFLARAIDYTSDGYESDNNSSQAKTVNIGTSYYHTYYPSGDEDWIKFTATAGSAYTIETLNLTNGADTHLFLYSTDGATLITSNDDRSFTDASSLITWTAASGGTYFVRSKSYSDSGAISSYGSYYLKVSAQ